MPQTVNEQVIDQITATNAKMLADMSQTPMGISVQNVVQQQARQNDLAAQIMAHAMESAQRQHDAAGNIALAIQTRAVHTLLNSAEQATAFEKTMGGIASKITDIEAALSGSQIFEKTAVTSPPQTGTGGAFGSDAGSALLQQIVNRLAIIEARLPAEK